ncbi:MAG: response regulator [Phycisphaerales bacterium]|nr:response regulator [Phycisphaerales bacterium]MCB9836206.1 response regulator [Phycisphaera sp.]
MDRKRLLLVDDEPHVTLVLSRKLEREGYEVRTARDGEEGYQTARGFQPDLIVSDLQMPRMDGLGMATTLAGDPTTFNIPILMLSGRGFLLDKQLAATTRIVRVLEKPFAASDIIRCAGEILGTESIDKVEGQAA